ncbi:MAG TPA: hypothetical protein ENK12_05195 [Gammaproteobacteria bacterium]|nr:hypothetical protein [Gammaproteobacteria bacterium]
MKTLLCYGDSNTWGYIPGSGARLAHGRRWPDILQARLGPGFRVIDEGLSGRFTRHDDPAGRPGRNGAELLMPLLESHAPLDLVILMLGTNDVLHLPGVDARDAAAGAEELVRQIDSSSAGHAGGAPGVLLVSPPRIGRLAPQLAPACAGDPGQAARFPAHFAAVAERRRCAFLDAARVVEPSPLDGVHLDEAGHAALAAALAELILAGAPA